MTHIKIFGVGGSKYLQLLNILFQAKALYPSTLQIEEINDIDLIMAHNIDTIPALQINNSYYHNLSITKVADVVKLLQSH